MKKLILFGVLTMFTHASFSVDYSDTPAEGSKGEWGWLDNSATKRFENGMALGIGFGTENQCNSAYFLIVGNDEIDSILLKIDGKHFSGENLQATTPSNDTPLVGFPLSKSALRELKDGSSVSVETNKGTLTTSLSGSAYSMNMAYGNCMKAIGSTSMSSGTLQPSRRAARAAPVQQQAPTYNQQEIERQRRAAARDADYRRCIASSRAIAAGASARSKSVIPSKRHAAGNAAAAEFIAKYCRR